MKIILQKITIVLIAILAIGQIGYSQCSVDGGMISTTDPTTICVDGVPDPINVTVSGSSGAEFAWIITDDANNILATPAGGPFDLDGAGGGTCLIWYIRHDGTLAGNTVGNNITDLTGCFDLSNEITVVRNEPLGGTLTGGPYEFCVDGIPDNIPIGEVTASGNQGMTSQWVVTDDQRNILGLPPTPDVVDFDGAGGGTCYIYHVSYYGTLTGLEMGMNLDNVTGCFAESDNFVTVVRNEPLGGTLTGGPYEFCVDGQADNIPVGEVTVSGNQGMTNQWVVTDDQRNILGLPPSPDVVNFDGAGGGTCYIYHVSYYGTLTGLEMGMNLDNVTGCFAESDNFVTVVRNEPLGGTLTGGPYEFCLDGQADNIPVGEVTVSGNQGMTNQWVVTDDQRNILGLPPSPDVVNFDGAGGGTCYIYHLSYYGTLTGLEMGMSLDNVTGCFAESDNFVVVVRNEPLGGTLAGGPYEFCVGDGEADNIPMGDVTVSGNQGPTSQWVVTDDQRNILGLPPSPDVVNFDGAGGGMCYIYNVSYYGTLTGLEMGMNLDNVMGCFAESDNFITVVRNQPDGGTLSTDDETTICVDGTPDPIDVEVEDAEGANAQWIITNDTFLILAKPAAPPFDLDGAGPGVCLIWYMRYDGVVMGDTVGGVLDSITGCFDLSDSIAVVRNEPLGGTLTGGPYEFCVDGQADNIPAGEVTVSGNQGATNQWVVTDDQGNILGLPPSPDVVDFDGAGGGTCRVYHVSYYESITGLAMGMNLDDLEGCFEVSDNFVTVVRNEPLGGSIDGGPYEFCVGDGDADNIPVGEVTISGNQGATNQWIVTDDQRNILGLPPSPDAVDFDGAGGGVCRIYHVSYYGTITGLAMGMNLDNLTGCLELSNNFVSVVRNEPIGGTIAGGPYEFCVGDGEADNIPVGDVTISGNQGTTNQWIVTDDQRNILGLPPAPHVVDFDGAGDGTCRIYHVSYYGMVTGLAMGSNLDDLEGCLMLSDNFVTVVRNDPEGGMISTNDPTTICVDGTGDPIDVSLTGASGANSAWVITDEDLNILALPPAPPFDLDGAGPGICLIWHLSFEDGLTGAEVGMNAADLEGCFDLSNSITVIRDAVDGATVSLANGETIYAGCPGDIVIEVDNTTENVYFDYFYVITNEDNIILEWVDASTTNTLDLSAAPAGICRVWGWNSIGTTTPVFGQPISTLVGEDCEELSDNFITVFRENPDGGTIMLDTGETYYEGCAGEIDFDLNFETSTFHTYWFVVTDDNSNILAWFNSDNGGWIDINGAPPGVCRIYGWSETNLPEPVVGAPISSLDDPQCGDISENFVTINRLDCDVDCMAEAATISTTDDTVICVDGNPDPIDVAVDGGNGANSAWVITDDSGTILALPAMGPFDLDGAGEGVCLIWYLTYDDVEGLAMGENANDLDGCFALSNPITVYREAANGGLVELAMGGTEANFCAGDVVFDVTHETTANNLSYWYVITDDNDNILAYHNSADGPTLDLSGAPVGTCHVWGWSYKGEALPVMGENISTLNDGDCESISSNFLVINRVELEGANISTTDDTTICVDGEGDPINVDVEGGTGSNSAWVITDEAGNILGLPPMGPFDLDGAGEGVCLIWYVTYESISGVEVGLNANDLEGCFVLSNAITVIREAANGGTVELATGGTEGTYCAGDIVIDVTHETTAENLPYYYVITDADDNILVAHNTEDGPTLDLSAAPPGECHIWGWSQKGEDTPVMGENISTLTDGTCEAISENFIRVIRLESAEAATLSTEDDTTICVDGEGDPIDVIVEGGSGSNSAWVITDEAGTILGLPPMGPFDLDGAGEGVCLIWYVTYETISGVEVGLNANDLEGCFALSNPITVIREAANGGTVELAAGGTEGTYCAGNIVIDVTHETTAENLPYYYIITDADDNILVAHNTEDGPTLDLSAAPPGECHIWGWSQKGEDAPVMGENISTLTDGTCESISENFIRINREEQIEAATISTEDDTVICVDGEGDPIDVAVEGGTGSNSAWVITDEAGTILALPPMGPFDLDGAGEGVCLIWYVTYESISGVEVGLNANDLQGCFGLSNPITVYREAANGGTVELATGGSEGTYCAGDIVIDVTHETTANNLPYYYIITDADDNILVAHNTEDGPTLDLSAAPPGECHIWGWSQKGEDAPVMGENISTLTDGTCEAISENFIRINRAEELEAAVISTLDETTICVDGEADPINVDVEGGDGNNSAWVITDDAGTILALPPMGPFDLDGAGDGVCLIWYVTYESISGVEVGLNANDLEGCFALSNAITVTRQSADGGIVALENGQDTATYCVGNIVFDVMHETTATALGYWYIITDDNDNILEFHNTADGPTLDLSGAPAGECHIWGWSSNGETTPVQGESISSLDIACGSVSSNFISIFRAEGIVGGTISTESSTVACPGDGDDDIVELNTTGSGDFYAYIVTNEDNEIMGAPYMTPSINFENMEPGIARIHGLGYAQGIEIGSTLDEITGSCSSLSENFIEVEIQDNAECAVTSTTEIDANDVRIYPNPAVEFVTLEYTDLAEDAKVNVFNVQGRLVRTQNLYNNSGSTRIDFDSMVNGIYLIRVTSSERSITKRIMITK